MLRLLLTCFAPLVLLCACGGGGGGGGGNPGGGGNGNGDLAKLSQCTADAFAAVARLTDRFEALVAEINGVDRPEVTIWDPVTGAYSLDADLNDDDFDESTANGQVTAVSGDFRDGLDDGEEIAFSWNLIAGPVNGGGQFGYAELVGNQRTLSGSGNVVLLDGCAASLTNLDLTFSTVSSGPPSGTFDISVTKDGVTLDGSVSMNGSAIATVSGTFNSVPFSFEIDTDDFSLVP